MPEPLPIPVLGSDPVERCDAQRNRRRILAAARQLFGRDGVEHVSLDQIAAAAGVGKGTVFRRFGDRGGLLRAVLDDGETAFQEAFIRGPAPLGPGAPARERLLAFGPAMLAHVETHGELLRAAERSPAARMRHPVYATYRMHLMILLAEAAPGLDAAYAADALLAPMAADLCLYQLQVQGMSLEQLADGWRVLAGRLISA
ncbi:MAG: TetR/AcrR family transcriptional regulator [Solirubrobacterales bacterium]|nr:TetR/AcrR family transcriptional regulator [Solirubrobacterales bacterium]